MDVQQAYAQRQRVSALGYWIGGLLMLGAIIGGIVTIASEGIAMVEEFQSAPGVSVPSEGTLTPGQQPRQ